MHDLSDTYLPKIENHKIPNLDLGENIHPGYFGLSILNFPATLSNWLGAPKLPHPALQIPELSTLMQGMDQVIVVLIDALSISRFKTWMTSSASLERSVLSKGLLLPITSVVPSTTTAALTTLWTGRSPSEHGILGYELFLREYGIVTNMITHSPAAFDGQPGMLYQAGFNPEKALPVPSLGAHLSQGGTEIFALLSKAIQYSGLSRMHYPEVDLYGYSTVSDLWHIARQLVHLPLSKKRLIWIYYGAVDTLSHQYGPDSEQARTEFISFMQSMHDILIKDLTYEMRKRSILLLLSDHGQITTPDNPHLDLSNHPSLTNRLHIQPTGEHRFSYLYPRPGQSEAIAEYIEKTWPRAFRILRSIFALENGLFGPGVPTEESYHRVGDQIVISQGNNYLWWGSKPNTLRGKHGGLSFDEMIVPLYVLPLE